MATLEEVIVTCLMTPRNDPYDPACVWGVPLNIIGLSGGGKSERVAQACRMVEMPYQVVFPASKQPEDFGGAPFATEDGIVIECILPQANKLMNQGFGVLVIDELSTARPAVQASALGLVNDRRVGDHLLPPKVRVLTAMNPPEYAAGGFVLEAPLANRLMHVTYNMPTVDEWVDWLTGANKQSFQNVQNAEMTVMQNWNNHWSSVRGLLAGFMQSNRGRIHQQPKPDDPKAGGPWPSPRMWNWAGRAIAASRCLSMPRDVENIIIQGCVGDGVLTEWAAWVAKADLPHPHDMLTKGWKPDKQRLDITIAAMTSMASWLCEMKDDKQKLALAPAAWNLVGRVISEKIPDLAVRPASALVEAGLGNQCKDVTVKEAAKPVILELGRGGYSRFQGAAV
jgi:hypothetical protein